MPPEVPGGLTRIVRYDEAARAVLAITDNSNLGGTPDFMGLLERTYRKAITQLAHRAADRRQARTLRRRTRRYSAASASVSACRTVIRPDIRCGSSVSRSCARWRDSVTAR